MDSLLVGDHADSATIPTVARYSGDDACWHAERRDPHAVWVPLSNGWILDGGLKLYRGDPPHAGRSIAALKLLLTLTLLAGGAPIARASAPTDSVLVSYEELTAIAGLSRPLIAAARKMLCGHGVLRVTFEGQGGRVRYHLEGRASARGRLDHALAPDRDAASAIACFKKLSCRETRNLHALKVYVLVNGLRGHGEREIRLSRAEIEGFTNLRESQVVAAFAVLRKHGLVAADARAIRMHGPTERFAVTVNPLS